MVVLEQGIRNQLERAMVAAREAAENAASAALKTLAVGQPEPYAIHTPDQRRLRNALRAKARQLGGGNVQEGIPLLVEEVAYEQWHRMLFARFLAENGLLMHPSGAPVTIEECGELAAEGEGPDAWHLAATYASKMLPGIFRMEEPSNQIRFAPEGQAALEAILADLPQAVFISDDGLGWVYQFWQSKRKKEVSQSGRKIERLDLAAYSQLFTEHYMVRFLLENSLGSWWAARHPDSPLAKEFTYLRYRDDGMPATGAFPGWPEHAAEITMMDPCCGSGHFLVSAFEMLRRMRMEEEGLAEADAGDAVMRDNLFGLEIDPRCVQIAAFSLALAAWKSGGYRPLPLPNIACSGIPVSGQLGEWTKLAGDDVNLRHTLERLHHLFSNAPDLGSLINPSDMPVRDRMFEPDFVRVAELVDRALAKERTEDPVAAVFGQAAHGLASAGRLLAQQYTLLVTNVPYLKGGDQGDVLKRFISNVYPAAKANLATAFIERCRSLTQTSGTYATVTPENWRFLKSYKSFRERLVIEQNWNLVATLGAKAFEIPMWDFNIWLTVISNRDPKPDSIMTGLDVASAKKSADKDALLRSVSLTLTDQMAQLRNPDSRIVLGEAVTGNLLELYAKPVHGLTTGDLPRMVRYFWEFDKHSPGWIYMQSSVPMTQDYGGRSYLLFWNQGQGPIKELPGARTDGREAWGELGVLVSQMANLACTLYTGEAFDVNTTVLWPKDRQYLEAIWAFCSSKEFRDSVRRVDNALKVTSATLAKVPFDLPKWLRIAEEMGPLPDPISDDPTQWLFKGDPADSTEPLQVAVTRMLGYHWPQQKPDRLSPLADQDDIAPLSGVAGQEPAVERLRSVLAEAFGKAWSPEIEERLLQWADFGGKGLDIWLRDGFFEQHCRLFRQRPFIWHIWDGRRDGFSVLVNYHRLDTALLERLIYTYLGNWIRTQRAARDTNVPGAEARLVAAIKLKEKLESIREGERPYDIYVRWKPLHRQSIGWNPDLNDGVRLNIRPFVMARVLRSRVNVNWKKDRGKDPDGSERINDRQLTLAEKWKARADAEVAS